MTIPAKRRAAAIDTLLASERYDHLDLLPRRVSIVPAGAWGIYTPGLRHAQPFDGLLGVDL